MEGGRGRRLSHLQEDAVKHGNSGDGQTQEKDQGEKEVHCGGPKGAGGRRAGEEKCELRRGGGNLRHKNLSPSLSFFTIQKSGSPDTPPPKSGTRSA